MSYETLRADADWTSAHPWAYCVLDEGHVIHNPKSKLAQVCVNLRCVAPFSVEVATTIPRKIQQGMCWLPVTSCRSSVGPEMLSRLLSFLVVVKDISTANVGFDTALFR